MAETINTYTGDGVTNSWTVGFNYLNKSHVKLFIDGVEDVTYTWITDSSIAATIVPINGADIIVQRVTPRDALVTTIAVSGTLRGNDVNRIGLQALYVAQEGYDALIGVMAEDLVDGKWDAQSKVIKDLGAPTNPNDAARYVDVTTIAGSAAAAAASASAASASASAANVAKTAAELAETNAELAETNAEAARDAAIAAQAAAELAETNAETAETNAEAARDLALTYRDTASTHATTATTQAGIATTQAGIAATQAGLADTARVAAQLAETNAEAAQTAAEAAQTAAEAALDSFDDKYLGSKASAPTLDNDGNALVEGQLYWNSVTNKLNIYTGGSWTEVGGGGGASVTVSDTAPVAPAGGDLWYDSSDGTLNVYYEDGTSNQWVDVSANAGPAVINDDTLAADSDTAVPSQSSVKQYVDTTAIAKSLLTTRGDIITRGASAPQRLALGASGKALKSDGTDVVWGNAGLTAGTAVATTSGSTVDFGSLPAAIKLITIQFAGVSVSSTAGVIGIRIGTGGVVATSGYVGIGGGTSSTAYFPVVNTGSNAVLTTGGIIHLARVSGDTWALSANATHSGGTQYASAGFVTLSGELDIVQFYLATPTYTFDAGAVNIFYE